MRSTKRAERAEPEAGQNGIVKVRLRWAESIRQHTPFTRVTRSAWHYPTMARSLTIYIGPLSNWELHVSAITAPRAQGPSKEKMTRRRTRNKAKLLERIAYESLKVDDIPEH